MRPLLDWLDHRTGYRTLLRHILDEELPGGTGWAFTTGSVMMLLLGVQFVTGVALAMYYVPTPSLAYDSVRYITDTLTLGWLARGLHHWGASFMVVGAVVHMLRVFLFGSFKAPREMTWMTGVVMLLVILAFALSGYLLPWDQKAYWATTVTINIAAGTPVIGEYVADVLRGGGHLGALTLGRWYAAHVFLLPGAIVLFVVAHVALMRRHGISGPIGVRRGGSPITFFPWHVIRDTVMMAAVLTLLLAVAVNVPAPLDEIANPADASYVPRPDWYFLSLFELLKYFPGPLEPVATMVIPGLVVGFLFVLPFLDRRPDRRPFSRSRMATTLCMLTIGFGVGALTAVGLTSLPRGYDPDDWGPRAIVGHEIVAAAGNTCGRCHASGGPAAELASTRVTKDEDWLLGHMADPVAIAPGVRPETDPEPPRQLTQSQSLAVVAYLRRVRAGALPPQLDDRSRTAARVFAGACAGCHKISGEGGTLGPDLSTVGARRDAELIRQIIRDPKSVFPDSDMPRFAERFDAAQLDALVAYLAGRR